jgi:hypothetical protein
MTTVKIKDDKQLGIVLATIVNSMGKDYVLTIKKGEN